MPILFTMEDAEACIANLHEALSFLKRVAAANAAVTGVDTTHVMEATSEIGQIIGIIEAQPPDDQTLALLTIRLSNALANMAEAAEPLLP